MKKIVLVKKVVSVVLISGMLFCLGGITGCSKAKKSNTKTVVDCSGASVEIKNDIQRVIAPNQPFCSFMIAMGQGDKLIGSHGSVIGHTWAPYFKEDILSIEMYGYKPEAELLYAANADLIVVKNSAYAEALRNEGLPAIYFGYNNLDELMFAVDLMGEIFGDEAKEWGKCWKAELQGTIDTINQDLSSLSESDKKNVYYINGAVNPGNLYTTFGGNSFTEYWINTIGANLVTSPYKDIEEIDQEVAISLNPDTIFISGYAEYTRYDELMADPLWSDVVAVKNSSVYLMPTSLVSFDRFAVELPLLLDYSTNVLYPELHSFNGIDDFRKFFVDFYGVSFSDANLNNMLLGLNPDGTRMD